MTTNNAISSELAKLIKQKPYSSDDNLILLKCDLETGNYDQLVEVVGLEITPSILLMVNGKGMWISGANVPLLIERLKEFLPDYLSSSSNKAVPRYAGFH